MQYRLGFIGCGNMAQAIANGAIEQGIIDPKDIIASDPSETNRGVFAAWGCATTGDNLAVTRQAGQVLLAVKPQVFPQVAPQLTQGPEDQVLISIMAGLSSDKIASLIDAPCRIVRVMPNTPALVGAGMAGIALGQGAEPGDDALCKQLFNAVGKVVEVTEPQIDAITAVSGSGPAYLFYLAEAMEKAADELGLGDDARLLVAQTLLGASKLLIESGEAPAELRRKVTSPGGTTQAACESMDQSGVMQAVTQALHAAHQRARELGG